MAAIASLGGVVIGAIPSRAIVKVSESKPKRLPWWVGKSTDQQRAELKQYDPATNPQSPYTIKAWNKELKRIARAEDRWMEEVQNLKRQCYCRVCLQYHRARFPEYYVKRLLSFECHLERREEMREAVLASGDGGLIDDLRQLEGENRTPGMPRIRSRDYAG